ncbi:MAG: hypothetical protein ABI351_01700 [Herbaspirillum sp.]
MNTPTIRSTDSAEQAIDQASNVAHQKIDQTSDALHPKVERIAQGAHEAVEKLASVATQATQQWGVKTEQIKTAQQKLTDECRAQVREKPVAALAIAAGIGFLISRLFRR